MESFDDLVARLAQAEGQLMALEALNMAALNSVPPAELSILIAALEEHADAVRASFDRAGRPEQVRSAFERGVDRARCVLSAHLTPPIASNRRGSAEAVLLTAARISTFAGARLLTGASGFFFRRHGRLYLVTNRHVLVDESSGHHPDRVEIELHTDVRDLTRCTMYSMPLFRNGLSLWRDATDSGGAVDVAVIEVESHHLPVSAVLFAFDEANLDPQGEDVAVGDALMVIGFPLGFHDTVHHLAVARSASVASAYGVRFQQLGYFLTDARTHRGSSGAPVLRRRGGEPSGASLSSWQLLGVHSTRMDMRSRDLVADESLGLNCVWYADVLLTLTDAANFR